ncbi:hypothetical protein [Methanobrevibacter arboriphilus]|uniref:hypothetical protein n=1 Tax=Methanobrevibacter arboriphilus TaxID=39441 RepID=UPI000B09E087|nr:hypothetical protein [Methanobrevibacter arboriphilus]
MTDYSSNLGENNIESNNIQDIAQENVNNLSSTNESTNKVKNTSNTNSNTNINTNNNPKTTVTGKAAAGEPSKLTQSQILKASKTINSYIKKV